MKSKCVALCLLLACVVLRPSPAAGQEAEARQANEALREKQYEKSARLFAEAYERGERRAEVLLAAASAASRAGRKEEAFKYLSEAVERGYHDAELLKKGEDLAPLRTDPRWPAALARGEANARQHKSLWAAAALRTPFRENLSEDEKVAGLSKVWSEAKFNFVNFDLVPELDWDALYLSYLPRVRQTKTTKEFYNVLEEFLARLRDGHTNLTYPKELQDEVYARPLLRTRLLEDRVLVVRADEGLKREGVLPGLEVVAVDGVPVREYAERRVEPFMSASTRQDLETRTYEYWLLRGPATRPVELTLRDAEGREIKKLVPRVTTAEARKAAAPLLPFEFKMLPGNVAYVALNSFADDEAAKQFEAKFAEISQADALVIDVRENGGGNSTVGWRVLGHLTDKYHLVTRWRTRQYRPSFRAWNRLHDAYFYGESGFLPAKVARHYAKPVVVLTSPRTYSAAEDFASAFDVMRRGLIVGEPTGGSTGQPLFFELPGGGNARVTTKRDTYPDGTEFVGTGVRPDRAVRPTVEDQRRGRDSVLETALEAIKKGEK